MLLPNGQFPFKKNPKHPTSLTEFTINPETFRIITYIGFWFMVLVGAILTFLYIPQEHLSHSPLVKTYGYNNICIFFDHPPSVYWTSQIYSYLAVTFYLYIFLIWLRTFKAYKQEIVDYSFFCFSTVVSIIQAILLSGFHLIFVISPSVNMVGHSVPFIGLEVLLVLNAVHNLLFFRKALVFPRLLQNLALLYVVCFAIVSFLKIEQQITALFSLDLFRFNVLSLRILDLSWLVLAAIVPLFLAFFFRRRIAPISFHF